MAFAAAIGPIIGAIASLAGALISASAQKQAADDEERAAKWNAARDREEASYAQASGALEAKQLKREADQAASRSRAARAQSGLAGGTGSGLLLEESFESKGGFNQRVAVFNSNREAKRLENQADIGVYEGKVRANAKRAQASASIISGFAGAASAIGGAFG